MTFSAFDIVHLWLLIGSPLFGAGAVLAAVVHRLGRWRWSRAVARWWGIATCVEVLMAAVVHGIYSARSTGSSAAGGTLLLFGSIGVIAVIASIRVQLKGDD